MDAVVEMKKSVVDDFFEYMNQLQKARYNTDTSNMLAKILFIESASRLNKFQYIYEKLI